MDTTNNIRNQFAKLILLFQLVFLSCSHNSQSSTSSNDSTTIESRKVPIDSICSLDKNYLEKIYGTPVENDTFLLNLGVHEFRVELYNIFRPKYLETHEVYINENTWKIDSIYNFTVWYHMDNDSLLPVDSCRWDIYTEF
ncbi:MAG: hypothetical protein LBV47_05045 [Bacteroidales bacterium]|jgi:hypothetical protein|nr:hypothetical protein [Bacteroidales bacterium]